jgi:hypothetical protein
MEARREADLQNLSACGGMLEPRVLIQKVYRDLIGSIISEQSLQDQGFEGGRSSYSLRDGIYRRISE